SNSSDPHDPYLRAWGSGGTDTAAGSGDMEQYSYSYLRFDVSKVPAGKLSSAKLMLTHISGPSFTLEAAKQNPLIVRPISADFTEKTWDFGQVDRIAPEPGPKAIFGKGAPESLPAADKEFVISIDLMKGPKDFSSYLDKSIKSPTRALGLSLTTTLEVNGPDGRTFYKVYSKDCETALKRPVLRLSIDN
ncbi:MAG: hypothetical protein ACHQ50_17915, partial [Fimbriimonadales bacterium]